MLALRVASRPRSHLLTLLGSPRARLRFTLALGLLWWSTRSSTATAATPGRFVSSMPRTTPIETTTTTTSSTSTSLPESVVLLREAVTYGNAGVYLMAFLLAVSVATLVLLALRR